jgi:hypothetical protein
LDVGDAHLLSLAIVNLDDYFRDIHRRSGHTRIHVAVSSTGASTTRSSTSITSTWIAGSTVGSTCVDAHSIVAGLVAGAGSTRDSTDGSAGLAKTLAGIGAGTIQGKAGGVRFVVGGNEAKSLADVSAHGCLRFASEGSCIVLVAHDTLVAWIRIILALRIVPSVRSSKVVTRFMSKHSPRISPDGTGHTRSRLGVAEYTDVR